MRLTVIIEDRTSDLVAKGEILEGYFNPAGAFDHVTVVSLIGDPPPMDVIEYLCAPAAAEAISPNIDRRLLVLALLGLRISGLERILAPTSARIASARPDLIRAYGDGMAAVAAQLAAQRTGISYIVSLHQTRDPEIQARYFGYRDSLWRRLLKPAITMALQQAAGVIAVYSPILDFLPPEVAARTRVIPNIVGVSHRPEAFARKDGLLKALWVSRMIPGRDPRPVIEALALVDGVELTLVGDGPLRGAAHRTVQQFGLSDRVTFLGSVPNADLCTRLPEYDVMLVNSAYREIPKSVIEAILSGVPIIANRSPTMETKEYDDLPVSFVQGDAGSYADLLRAYIADPNRCDDLARQTAEVAWQRWDPKLVAESTAEFMTAISKMPRGSH